MVDTSELESFLNEKSAKEGDSIKIIEEGDIEEKEDPQTKRRYKVLNIPVRINNSRDVIYSPNNDAIRAMQKEWGMDTKKWIDREFKIKFYPKTSFGITRTAILPVF